jgi:protein phosphatase 2C family protein 2/3
VRYQIYEGKELKEIGENICEHCLAPDTTSGAGIGCDNMTVLIVAILHGRTKEEWYSWMRDRVEKKHGYNTPSEPPYLYSPVRLRQFRARREIMEARGLDKTAEQPRNDEENGLVSFLGSAGLGGFARVLGSTGGISFSPESGLMSGNARLMFGNEDSDDDDDDSLDGENGDTPDQENGSIFGNNLQVDGSAQDSTSRLKARLEEFERDLDGDTHMADATSEEAPGSKVDHKVIAPDAVNGEAPLPPPPQSETQPHVNGGTKNPITQLKSEPLGDAPNPVVTAEGLIDKSEDPIKVSAIATA